MTVTNRMPTAEKKQTPLVQAHAFDHYLHGQCNGSFPIDDARSDMRCPLCLRWLPRSDFSLEHAPQKSEQSRLGPAWLLVSACKRCNSEKAGATFESDAAQIARKDAVDQAGSQRCGIHGTDHAGSGFDLGWITNHVPVTLADIKSAYLIAFAVLGYSWVCSRALDPVRVGLIAANSRPRGSHLQPADCSVPTTNAESSRSSSPSQRLQSSGHRQM